MISAVQNLKDLIIVALSTTQIIIRKIGFAFNEEKEKRERRKKKSLRGSGSGKTIT